ncbi:MAG: YihY/virulence factor BrkB family protein [Actinomycetota bacterium]
MTRRRLGQFLGGFRLLLRRVDLPTLAAAIAYHTFLALVPLALALLGAAALIGESARALDRVRTTLETIAPATVAEFVLGLLVEAESRLGGQEGWVIALSVVLALVLGSRATLSLQRALAAVEGHHEARRGVPARLIAVGLTVGGGFVLLLASLLLVAGGHLVEFIVGLTGAGWLGAALNWLRIPVTGTGLYFLLLACYRWGPSRPLPRPWLAALVGTTGALLSSLGFGLYLSLAPALGATFGILGAVAVALVWLYSGALAILLGAAVVSYSVGRRAEPESGDSAPGAE